MRRRDSQPWGTLLGLLAACLATISGAVAGLDPDVVLLRAIQAGLAAALLWSVARLIFVTVLDATSRK